MNSDSRTEIVCSATRGTVEFREVSKSYPGVRALQGVSLVLRPGTVTAIAGENGAGKSTFIKLLAGAEILDEGTILLDGAAIPTGPRAAIDAGISVIYQELTDVPDMSVLDNLLLGQPPATAGLVSKRQARETAKLALLQVGLDANLLDRAMRQLPMAQRQLVEIARCLCRDSRVIVFDEPTSALAEGDVEALLETIEGLRDRGLTILYVSHHLDEVFRVATDIAVLRDGHLEAIRPASEWSEQSLVQAMLAKSLEQAYPWRPRELGGDRLEVRSVRAPGVRDASIHVRAGEIVGLAGLAGAGRTELMKAIAGFSRREEGHVSVDGDEVGVSSAAARRAGIVYAPEDRKSEGLVLGASVADNISYGLYSRFASFGWIRRKRQARLVRDSIQRFGIKVSNSNQSIAGLSGGNQQKVVLSRVAAGDPTVVLLDDPTRGVDVGAKATIHEHLLSLAEKRISIVVTSSDTDEVLAVCDRVYVLRGSRIVGELTRSEFDREKVLRLASAG